MYKVYDINMTAEENRALDEALKKEEKKNLLTDNAPKKKKKTTKQEPTKTTEIINPFGTTPMPRYDFTRTPQENAYINKLASESAIVDRPTNIPVPQQNRIYSGELKSGKKKNALDLLTQGVSTGFERGLKGIGSFGDIMSYGQRRAELNQKPLEQKPYPSMLDTIKSHPYNKEETFLPYLQETTKPTERELQLQMDKEQQTPFMKGAIDVSQSVGRMIPGVLAGVATGNPATGLATNFASIYGANIGENIQGKTQDEMKRDIGNIQDYSLINSALETGMQYALGGIKGLSGSKNLTSLVSKKAEDFISNVIKSPTVQNTIKNVSTALVSNTGEGLEEYLQGVIDPVVRNFMLNEQNNINPLTPDKLYQGALGFITAGILNGASGGVKTSLNKLSQPMQANNIVPPDTTNQDNVINEEKTDSFKKWFGNFENSAEKSSKVIGENGKPLIVYHGTKSKFDKFDTKFAGKGNDQYGSGFYFTTDKDTAKSYTDNNNENIIEAFLNIKNPIVINGSNGDTLRDVEITPLQAYKILKQSPNIMDKENSVLGDWFEEAYTNGPTDKLIKKLANDYNWDMVTLENDFFKNNTEAFRNAVKSVLGYDGVQVNFKDNKHYVAWFPEQIRFANTTQNQIGIQTNPNQQQQPQQPTITKNEFLSRKLPITDQQPTQTIPQILSQRKINTQQQPQIPTLAPAISRPINQIPALSTQEFVKNQLPNKIDAFERMIYGDSTADIVGGTKGANIVASITRPVRESYNRLVQKGLSSENNTARRIAIGLRMLMGRAGSTQERINQQGLLQGGKDTAINLANDFMKLGSKLTPDEKQKIWAILDPELAGITVDENTLSPQGKIYLSQLRQASDIINDTNFTNGFISEDVWNTGKDGKYITRAYFDYDLPPEISGQYLPAQGKLDLGAYKQRKDVDEWKQENAIKDPFYLMAKRLQSSMINDTIVKHSNWVATQKDMVSDTEKAGYTQLSDSKIWGNLSGKFVRNDVLTDIKGFHFASKILQGAYDALNAYDKWTPRQLLKKSKTIANPVTRLGNQISNRVFALLGGLNLYNFELNHSKAKADFKNNGAYTRDLRKNGVLGTDITKYELSKGLLKEGEKSSKIKSAVNTGIEKLSESYGAVDDISKVKAYMTLLDKGYTKKEAITRVRNMFQDYSKVGLLYDISSKTPLVGKPFVRFQSELARIIKNSALESPIALITTLGAIKLLGDVASWASGETEEERKTREKRYGSPVIPFTNIPLGIMTPYGEINIARMFGMYETVGADTKDKNFIQRISKYAPFDMPTNKEDVIRSLGNDVLLGGISNQITNTDFRGKPIDDPNATFFSPSTLTDKEKFANRVSALYHNYQLPIINDIENVARAQAGKENIYGQKQTVPQALSRLTGFKVQQFGDEEVQKEKDKQAQQKEYEQQERSKLINSVYKQLTQGKINNNTANERLEEINKKYPVSVQAATGNAIIDGGTLEQKPYPYKQKNAIFDTPLVKIDPRIQTRQDGKFSYLDTSESPTGTLVTVDNIIQARKGLNKMDFKMSGEDFAIKDGFVYSRSEAGNISVIPESTYNINLNTNLLSNLKKDDNYTEWQTLANSQLELLQNTLNSAKFEKDKAEIQGKISSLKNEIIKYKGYNGFTKPKTTRTTRTSKKLKPKGYILPPKTKRGY